MGYLKGAKYLAVPESTLKRFAKDKPGTSEEAVAVHLGWNPALPNESEKEFVQYCLDTEERSCGFRSKHIKNTAFHLAVRNG